MTIFVDYFREPGRYTYIYICTYIPGIHTCLSSRVMRVQQAEHGSALERHATCHLPCRPVYSLGKGGKTAVTRGQRYLAWQFHQVSSRSHIRRVQHGTGKKIAANARQVGTSRVQRIKSVRHASGVKPQSRAG
jgi:hypothetical protein